MIDCQGHHWLHSTAHYFITLIHIGRGDESTKASNLLRFGSAAPVARAYGSEMQDAVMTGCPPSATNLKPDLSYVPSPCRTPTENASNHRGQRPALKLSKEISPVSASCTYPSQSCRTLFHARRSKENDGRRLRRRDLLPGRHSSHSKPGQPCPEPWLADGVKWIKKGNEMDKS